MQFLKNNSTGRSLFSLCLLLAIFQITGCQPPKSETTPPDRVDPPVVDMDIEKPDSSSADPDEVTAPAAGSASNAMEQEQSPAAGSSGGDEMDGSDKKIDDSSGPILNAPKSTSVKPASGESSSKALVGVVGDALVPIKLLSWNVESQGADADVICEQLAKLNSDDRYDVVGLTEVEPPDWRKFREALGEHYRYEFSRSGYQDRMQILFNTRVFEKQRHFDLKEINVSNRYRAPLVVQLKHLETGRELLVMLNHLARGKAEIRQQQAKLLVQWARKQTLPIVAIGDYNFDYVFKTKKGNPAFKNMLQDNVWQWVQPEEMIDTNWFDEMGDGEDDYPGSMLDFAFVANAAKTWDKSCRVIVREGDFPDDDRTSDHRPFELVFN